MGRERRARGRAIARTLCYLCGNPIDPETQDWNRDHVPPKRIFASSVRRQFAPNLPSLPTHQSCNREAEKDEAYFVVSFVGHLDSDVAREVMRDIFNKVQRGEEVGLVHDVLSRFGKVTGPKGEVLFLFDPNRVDSFLWKVARGLYALEVGGAILPRQPPTGITLVNPRRTPQELESLVWFPMVRNTEPLGRYGRVFDYKWLSWKDGNLRGHALAMLFWDRLLGAMLFHDPACGCGVCDDWKGGSQSS